MKVGVKEKESVRCGVVCFLMNRGSPEINISFFFANANVDKSKGLSCLRINLNKQ